MILFIFWFCIECVNYVIQVSDLFQKRKVQIKKVQFSNKKFKVDSDDNSFLFLNFFKKKFVKKKEGVKEGIKSVKVSYQYRYYWEDQLKREREREERRVLMIN